MIKVEQDRRKGWDRRTYSPHLHIPERRTGIDRRKSIYVIERVNHPCKLKERAQHTDDCITNR